MKADTSLSGQNSFRSPKLHCCLSLLICSVVCYVLALGIRLLEWPAWQNPEYRLGNEMLLATHDAYHWVAGATGFGLAANHPMAQLLRFLAGLTGFLYANIAFWLPAFMAALVAVLVCLWCMLLGGKATGMAAGIMASIAPGFLGRTLLGYYDTDIVTLFFPLCMAFVPALFANAIWKGRINATQAFKPLDPSWIILLALSGIISNGMLTWHSVFPYLVRCNAIILFVFCFLTRPGSLITSCLLASLCHILPSLAGFWGLLLPFAVVVFLHYRIGKNFFLSLPVQILLWGCFCYLALRGDILTLIANHIGAYLKTGGDSHASGGVSLVFPSVAQSIIEVQDLHLLALLPYFHPWLEAAALGITGFFWVLWRKPCAVFLLPLLFLGFSSAKLGGRMVMFGAPVTAIGLCLAFYWLLKWLADRFGISRWIPQITAILLLGFFVAPFLNMIPALSQGPILNKRHAAALSQLEKITPENSMIWLWWDWGYAAQYFGRRNTICDGARHGGPSIYLPAAVLATDNPRFARQIIRRTAEAGSEPGNFFRGLNANYAQALINSLRSQQTPLLTGGLPQYLVISFETLKLGFWISNYGSWNFITQKGESGAISIVPQGLSYNLALGEVLLDGKTSPIYPISINVFEETGIIRKNYLQEWVDRHPKASNLQRLAWLGGRRNINFLFNRITDEKLAVGESIYNSLMVQLLLCNPGDQRFSPYFKLVYDNIFTRIYQVLGQENSPI